MTRWKPIALALFAAFALSACGADLSAAVLDDAGITTSITYGELDGDRHPMVGLMVAQNASGNPLWLCSGTLLSPNVFLTAGHCTYGATSAQIWFDATEAGIRAKGFPVAAVPDASGTTYTPLDYNPDAFFLFDVGVVVLDEPYDLAEYAELPEQDELDALAKRRGRQDTTFTAVGYGLQRINPVFVESRLDRMLATPRLVQINAPGFTGDFSLLLSNNASTGGTCFGDSGGPNFLGDGLIVAGVTSFGINGNCAGTGGVYRMDRAAPLEWVQDFLD